MERRLLGALSLLIISAVGCTNGVNGVGRYDTTAMQEAAHCPAPSATNAVIRPSGVYQNHGIRIDYEKLAPRPDPDRADIGYIDRVVRSPRMLEQVYFDATRGDPQASYSVCHFEVGASHLGRQAARYVTGLKCQHITDCKVHFNKLPLSETTASGFRLRAIMGETFETEARRRQLRQNLIAHVLTLLVGVKVASTVYTGPMAPPLPGAVSGPVRGFRSHRAFTRAMGPAGPGKQWHHIVEQTPGNVARFGPESLHNTYNVVRIDARIHTRINAYYSRIHDFTEGMTLRSWLSTQSFDAQYRFGLRVLGQFGVVP